MGPWSVYTREALQHLVLVVDEPFEHVVDARLEVGELDVGGGARHCLRLHLERRREVAQVAAEGGGLGDERGVVQCEACDRVARLEDRARRLEEADRPCLRRLQRMSGDLCLLQPIPSRRQSEPARPRERLRRLLWHPEDSYCILF